ncbi:SDR family oxidoreductase [Shewanella sp. 5_MG-2023]|uniref:UDP-glucose 4-epimerase family protein n=1 Tax=Shewanella sp. 5_MG-2023 TaxID=3062656 RepID=UPI0026E2258B|nr:SDR family oxidoreductase [Shewanella sp. 5_MG-2023]MDO6639183.1 SDR family oxidoreductase [Shewanella sp. 5_MG-2023]
MKNILLTGASGFIGRNLLKSLNGFNVSTLGGKGDPFSNGYEYDRVEINSLTDFTECLKDISVVVHCAARAHVMSDISSDPLQEYREVNTFGTLNLARQSVAAGVKRFIFISSIKVNGESTSFGMPYKHSDPHNPQDFYGQSKSEAELQLIELSNKTDLEVVIIRPTLVYGPGVKANYSSLLNLVSKGLPLPFGLINDNKRSLVSVKNLVDLIITCISHSKAINQVFLVSDDHDVSTASIVKHMSVGLGKSSRLLPVPLWCFRLAGKLLGKSDVVDRLLGSLQVDIKHTKDTLGWTPPQTLEEGFKDTAEAFILNKNI